METDDYYDAIAYRESQLTAVRKTIREISIAELEALGEKIFPIATDPWHERYFAFLAEHKNRRFYHAEANNEVQVIYCSDGQRAIWFLPGKSVGIVMPKGLQLLQEVTARL